MKVQLKIYMPVFSMILCNSDYNQTNTSNNIFLTIFRIRYDDE